MDWDETKQHFCILLYQEIIIKNNLKLFLRIKAKYKIVELIIVDSSFRTAIGITPDGPVVFSGSPYLIVVK